MQPVNYLQTTLFLAVILLASLLPAGLVYAQDSDEIEEKIDQRSEQIEQLEEEINETEGELQSTQEEAQTLEQAVNSFNQSINRISSKVAQTSGQISGTETRIRELENSITQTEQRMERNRLAIGKTVKALQRAGNQTFIEVLLSADSLSEVWNYSAQLQNVQGQVDTQIDELRDSRQKLEANKQQNQQRKQELASLQSEQADQQAILESQQNEKEQLLNETNREASEYQSIIAQKKAQKEQFEAQLRNFEAQLQSTADEGGYAEDGKIFSWPVESVVITQQFGGTEFAKQNPAAYGRPFHNGTDFGVPVGSPILAVAGGTVRATGNTDAVPGCYSYGKWVLLDHDNGLSTLYAHLSRRSVSGGQRVSAGDRIAYSGNTGYSTGPHLHLTTYIQDDVRVRDLGEVKQSTNCGGAQMPVAPLDSYLNSMTYLPN